MGLADRFKEKLNNKDIFEKTDLENKLENKDMRFISKPITEKITVQPQKIHNSFSKPVKSIDELPKTQISMDTSLLESNKFENLETEIINKIRKTPYWTEFSSSRQERMVSAYFDRKCGENWLISEKQEFIQNILALANNR